MPTVAKPLLDFLDKYRVIGRSQYSWPVGLKLSYSWVQLGVELVAEFGLDYGFSCRVRIGLRISGTVSASASEVT